MAQTGRTAYAIFEAQCPSCGHRFERAVPFENASAAEAASACLGRIECTQCMTAVMPSRAEVIEIEPAIDRAQAPQASAGSPARVDSHSFARTMRPPEQRRLTAPRRVKRIPGL